MDLIFGPVTSYGTGAQCLIFCARLLIAVLCGAAIGLERTRRFKDAGMRTHCIVACASASLMILSKYGFTDLVTATGVLDGIKATDAGRIAAQIVTGIGFLGAAVVFKQGNSVHGLTTAAGVWATASIGMLVGAGMEAIGIVVTATMIAMLNIFHRLNLGHDSFAYLTVEIEMDDDPELKQFMMDDIASRAGTVLETAIRRENGRLTMKLEVRIRNKYTYEDVDTILREHPGIYYLSV